MATLTGNTVQSTYKDLLQVSSGNNGVTGTLRRVEDGEGHQTELYLNDSDSASFPSIRLGSGYGKPILIGGSSFAHSCIWQYGGNDSFVQNPAAVGGSTSGLMIKGHRNAHTVICVSANDANDGFHVIGPQVAGNENDAYASSWLSVKARETVFNDHGGDRNFRWESESSQYGIMADAQKGKVGIACIPELEFCVANVLSAGVAKGGSGMVNICRKGYHNSVRVGAGQTSNRFAHLDLVGDTTYGGITDRGGLRLLRGDGGKNTYSQVVHSGTGFFQIIAPEQTGTGTSVMYFTQGEGSDVHTPLVLAKGENTALIQHKGTSASHAGLVVSLDSAGPRTDSHGIAVNWSTTHRSTQINHLTASNAFQVWNGFQYSYKIGGNGTVTSRGHFRIGDGNGVSVIQSISGGTSSSGTMTGGVQNGDFQFRTQRDSNLYAPYHPSHQIVTSKNGYVNQYSAAAMLSINGADQAGNPRGTVTVYGKIKPASTAHALDLGSSAAKWNDIWANGTVYQSDRSLKDNIQPTKLGLNFIKSLNPVSYKFKDRVINEVSGTDEAGKPIAWEDVELKYTRTHHGLIAQEVKESLDAAGLGTKDFAGYVDPSVADSSAEGDSSHLALRYTEFISPLIKAVQELTSIVEAQEDTISKLRKASSFAAFKQDTK